jgi:hypothetical protein
MLVTFNRGKDVACYAGPVMSHYEFTTPYVPCIFMFSKLNNYLFRINERKSDAQWREMLRKEQVLHPRWTRSFLVPGTNPNAAKYRHEDEGGRHF